MLKKIGAYAAVLFLLIASVLVVYVTIKESKMPPELSVGVTTRSGVDSFTYKKYEQSHPIPAGRSVEWGGLTTALLLVMAAYYKFNSASDRTRAAKDKEVVYQHIEGVGDKLTSEVREARKEVSEVKIDIQQLKRHNDEIFDRESVLRKMKAVEIDILNGFVDNDALRAFILGISTRAQDFAHEAMEDGKAYNFNDVSYHRAKLLIVGKMSDCHMHAEHLGFGKRLMDEIDKTRCLAVNALKGELKRLAADNITNHKFHRFGEIMTSFMKAFCLAVVKAYNIEQLKTGGKNEEEQNR
jgi:hypothetical protein